MIRHLERLITLRPVGNMRNQPRVDRRGASHEPGSALEARLTPRFASLPVPRPRSWISGHETHWAVWTSAGVYLRMMLDLTSTKI